MTYRIEGLDPARFADVGALIAGGAIRMIPDSASGYPCRVTLEDAAVGEPVLLLDDVSADVDTPFRASSAIYVREGATAASVCADGVPGYLDRRTLSPRGLTTAGMLHAAASRGQARPMPASAPFLTLPG